MDRNLHRQHRTFCHFQPSSQHDHMELIYYFELHLHSNNANNLLMYTRTPYYLCRQPNLVTLQSVAQLSNKHDLPMNWMLDRTLFYEWESEFMLTQNSFHSHLLQLLQILLHLKTMRLQPHQNLPWREVACDENLKTQLPKHFHHQPIVSLSTQLHSKPENNALETSQ